MPRQGVTLAFLPGKSSEPSIKPAVAGERAQAQLFPSILQAFCNRRTIHFWPDRPRDARHNRSFPSRVPRESHPTLRRCRTYSEAFRRSAISVCSPCINNTV
jgi:hypothetical protein